MARTAGVELGAGVACENTANASQRVSVLRPECLTPYWLALASNGWDWSG